MSRQPVAVQGFVSLTNDAHPVTFKIFPVCRAAANREQRNCWMSRPLIPDLLWANGKGLGRNKPDEEEEDGETGRTVEHAQDAFAPLFINCIMGRVVLSSCFSTIFFTVYSCPNIWRKLHLCIFNTCKGVKCTHLTHEQYCAAFCRLSVASTACHRWGAAAAAVVVVGEAWSSDVRRRKCFDWRNTTWFGRGASRKVNRGYSCRK